ncbi:MAG: biotin-independent malonate decarboxylase subunit gamma [Candidatus Obscuribacterales bacterium]|nr:biotin-independent malonate decarboxylase subunit gamma [Candidatus Obscuribacterales bacterium]
MSTVLSTRGRVWFDALTGQTSGNEELASGPASVLCADTLLGDSHARFLCVVPDAAARFPRAREGEVGVEEAYTLATKVREVIDAHVSGPRRPIIAVVDVKSQAYGRREETVAIHLAAAVSADAYATARRLGHPVIALVVGQALSGGFLTHGYQANRILALDDPGVIIHAMHKEAAARVTRRTVDELDKLAEVIVPLSYNIRDFAKLGILHELLEVKNAEQPDAADVECVKLRLVAAVEDARQGARDLSSRWLSANAATTRSATIRTRDAMFAQWSAKE